MATRRFGQEMSTNVRRFDMDSDDEEESKGGGVVFSRKPAKAATHTNAPPSTAVTRFEQPEQVVEAFDFSDDEDSDYDGGVAVSAAPPQRAAARGASLKPPPSGPKPPARSRQGSPPRRQSRFSPEDEEGQEGGGADESFEEADESKREESKHDDKAEVFAPVSPEKRRQAAGGQEVQRGGGAAAAAAAEQQQEDEEAEEEARAAYGGEDDAEAEALSFCDILRAPPAAYDGMVEALIVRNRSGICRLFPEYQLYFQRSNTLMLFASKQAKNRTSNYHMFDMTRGMGFGSKLTKKSGNYIGKLRSNYGKTENIIVSNHADRRELGAILFNKPSMVEQIKDGSQPRKMYIVVPEVDAEGAAVPVRQSRRDEGLLERVRTQQLSGLAEIETKDPTYENGNYRLNFNGRVTVPSVKNFQLVEQGDRDTVLMQFGKVGEDRFHMDFRAPLTAVQAFAIVLSQFNF